MNVMDRFRLTDRVAVITGGAGLLGVMHGEAVAEAGGVAVLWDLDEARATAAAAGIVERTGGVAIGLAVDITDRAAVERGVQQVLERTGRIDILINNAANDPKVEPGRSPSWTRLEAFAAEFWNQDIAVGLTGAFLCSQAIGTRLAAQGGGVILNIASDLGVIAPDQRLYRQDGLPEDQQPVKPVTYSVVKHGLIGLTKYLATYWAGRGVRANALSPGGVYTSQPDDFVLRLTTLIPMGRMARRDEYKAAVVFLCSDASAYMTGQNVVMDGGRTVL